MELEQQTDEALVLQIREGDQTALGVLTVRYRERLHRHIERSLGHGVRRKVAASDVLQEAHLVALRRLAEFEDRGQGSFRRWFNDIIEHRIREEVRRYVGTQKRGLGREVSPTRFGPIDAARSRDPTPSMILSGKELKEAARRALKTLPDACREVITLLQKRGLSLEEAAGQMGRSKQATKKLYNRALTRLEEAMGLRAAGHGRRRPTR